MQLNLCILNLCFYEGGCYSRSRKLFAFSSYTLEKLRYLRFLLSNYIPAKIQSFKKRWDFEKISNNFLNACFLLFSFFLKKKKKESKFHLLCSTCVIYGTSWCGIGHQELQRISLGVASILSMCLCSHT